MGVHRGTCMAVITLLLASSKESTETAVIQAPLDMGGHNNEFLQMVFKQIEILGNRDKNESTTLSQSHTELVSALLQVAPVITIKGNITDATRGLTITFTVQASQDKNLPDSADIDSDDEDEEDWDYDWRGSGGVFQPIVGVVEPYVLGLVELIFNGILSNIISNLLESISLIGDVRLV